MCIRDRIVYTSWLILSCLSQILLFCSSTLSSVWFLNTYSGLSGGFRAFTILLGSLWVNYIFLESHYLFLLIVLYISWYCKHYDILHLSLIHICMFNNNNYFNLHIKVQHAVVRTFFLNNNRCNSNQQYWQRFSNET